MARIDQGLSLWVACCFTIFLLFAVPLTASAQIDGKALLLVASAKMTDPKFIRTVVLVTRHGRSPPLGVIVNRPLGVSLKEVLPQYPLKDEKQTIFQGGPLAPEMLVFIYRSAKGSKDAISVDDQVHLGRAGNTLAELLSGQHPHTGLRVMAGYAAWANGQLENEIANGAWLIAPLDPEIVFDQTPDALWPYLIRRITQPSAQLSPLPQQSSPT